MRALVAAVLGLAAAAPLAGQSAQPWKDSFFPYILGSANDFPLLAARVEYRRQADYFAPYIDDGRLALDAGISTRGSRFVTVAFEAPGLWSGWRLHAEATANREARFGFYGIGNGTEFDPALVTDDQPFYYRVRRTRYATQTEVSRRLQGPLRLAVSGGVAHTRFTDLPDGTLFTDLIGSVDEDTDLTGRLALVYDSRDKEYNTSRGLLLEAGGLVGSGGDGYRRLYAVLRGYLTIREGTVAAVRLAGAGSGGTPPLNARFDLQTWERTISGYGGEFTNRGLERGRFAGEHVLFANVELRHDILNAGDLGALTAFGFLDAGRVFEGESFRITTDDLQVSAGGGLALRLLRATIFTFNFSGGPDGFNFVTGAGWMF